MGVGPFAIDAEYKADLDYEIAKGWAGSGSVRHVRKVHPGRRGAIRLNETAN
jgi:hypothetical protein